MSIRSLLAFLMLLAVPLHAQTSDSLSATRFDGGTFATDAYDYLLSLPDDYHESDKSWPLVLFLHGSGERTGDLSRVATHGPLRHVREGAAYPFVIVAPQQSEGAWWDARSLGVLLDHVEATHRVDPSRIYVTGLSMGGFGAWNLAETYPDRFAAVAPICGGGTPGRICAAVESGTQFWAFHGALDQVIPAQRSVEMIQRIYGCGGVAQLTVYPDAHHDSWTRTYADPAFWEWMLAQRRTDKD